MVKAKLLIVAVLLSVLAPLFAPPQKTNAWSVAQLPKCTTMGTDLDWNWKGAIESNVNWSTPATNRVTVGKTVDSWDGSVIMFRKLGGTQTYVSFGDKNVGPSAYYNTYGTNSAGKHYWTQNRFSGPEETASSLLYSWADGSHTITAGGHWTATDTERAPTDASQGTSGLDMSCIQFATDMMFTVGYTGYHYSGTIPASTGFCSGIDLGCRIAGFFNGIVETFQGFGEALLTAFTWLWIPDSDTMSTMLTDFRDSLVNTLGFIAYPFEFFTDLFTEVQTGGDWCSSTSCEISGGTMYGGTLTLDFLTLKNSEYSDVWTYFLVFIRGSTVLGLLYMIRSRLMETMQR